MRLRKLFALFLAPALGVQAQNALNPPTPLAPRSEISAGEIALSREAARRAQELGFPGIAVGLYRGLLAAPGAEPSAPGFDAANRSELILDLATALLDDGRPEEAEQALAGDSGGHGTAWHLRAALAAAQLRQTITARGELAAVKADELSARDRPWYLFLQGMLIDQAEPGRAGVFYGQAEKAADTDFSRARFLLAREQALLRSGPVNEEMARQAQQNAERFSGTATGYGFEHSHAVMLDALGRKGEAVEELQRDLLSLPATERATADDFRLLLGLIARGADGPGRLALIQLLETGDDPERKRVALRVLESDLQKEPGRSVFRVELDKLIAEPPTAHPILDDLLLVRAELALGDNDFPKAEGSANELLQKFPGSTLKPYALGILVGSAWDQLRYRTAADAARQTRDSLPAGETKARARLSAVEAEAWFRAGNFRDAADAYAAVLREPTAGIPPGDLMYQRVEAEIKSGNLKNATVALDDLAPNPAFDTVNRWNAEWNLARALEVAGDTRAAYDRVNRLLATTAAAGHGLAPDLRARMAWLQAQLSLDVSEWGKTLQLVDAMAGLLKELKPELRTQIASTGELFKAEASFELNRTSADPDAAARKILDKLRADYPQTDAAADSYSIEAQHYEAQEKLVEAQQLLTKMAEDFPQSPHAPFALYQAAILAERLGQENNLKEAEQLLDKLYTKYPTSDLVFAARLEQGNVLRLLNQFQLAQRAYEVLINLFPQNHDVILARLALAECDNAQSASDPTHDPIHEEAARSLFEEICLGSRPDTPVDVRVEAGYNLGLIYERRGRFDQAEQVWFKSVVTEFLLSADPAHPLEEKGRYWMARTLIDLGSLFQQQGKLGEAGNAWRRILEAKLPYETEARAKLASLNQTAPKP